MVREVLFHGFMGDSKAQRTEGVTATLHRGPGRNNVPLGAVIRAVDVKATPPAFRLTAGHCRIGTGAGCDLVLEDRTVSRVHAELSLVQEGVVVQDLGSRNGVFYLGQRVEKMVLSLGGRIQVGGATIAIDADTESLHADGEYAESAYRGMVGTSTPMRRLFAILCRLEVSQAAVLIEGESGVGKEMVARAIHDGSSVAAGPLVTLNCGAIPKDLVASELFGHRRGAFTGATETRKGAFDTADGGTLFLDEVGELPIEVQPMLLRVLETGEVRPVGGDASRVVKVRIVAATNRELDKEVEEGRFREDLFYRLAVVRLRVPPLRDRVEDVQPLAEMFARQLGIERIPGVVVEQLKTRPWAGNARELRNVLQAFAALGVLPEPTRSKSATLDLALRELVDLAIPYADQKDALVDRFTAIYLQVLLDRTANNQTVAARVAGLDRGYLGRLLAKHSIGKGRP